MENQTIVEIIDKNNFSMSSIRDTVYTTLSEKSTRENTLTLDNIKSTLSFTKPEFINGVKNPEKYYYLIMELGDLSG